jgi:hypothetical protein
MRDEIAARGAEAIDAMGEWLADPELCRFAVRVIGKAADGEAHAAAVAMLTQARIDTTPTQRSLIDEELRRLGIDPDAKPRKTPRRPSSRGPRVGLSQILYTIAQNADPERIGIHSELLWNRLQGTPAGEGRDAAAIASALNVAHDLFERVSGEPSTFRWREDVRAVWSGTDGALSGRRLAIVAHFHARHLDPSARGLNYQRLTGAIISSGDLISGVDWGSAVNKAVSDATDLFERIGRGEYRWRHVPMVSARGWMMRTDRTNATWLWSEVEAGRLRQGWGYQPKQDLALMRDRADRGEAFDGDDDLAWDNRRMLTGESGGIEIGDLILTPHLPREWRWSVLRVVGPYRYEIHDGLGDYGHILPVSIAVADVDPNADPFMADSLREAVRYPARLMRMSDEQTRDLHRLIG